MENIFSILFITFCLCYHSCVNGEEDYEKFHLPGFISPLKYDLTINTDPIDKIIHHKGDVRITIKCTDETKEIVVNRKYLEIDEPKVKVTKLIDGKEEGAVNVGDHDYNEIFDRYIIKLKDSLEKDKFYVVSIPFSKKVDTHLPDEGYIESTYESVSFPGYLRPYSYTKMGRIDARGIFPGLDQIDIKTPFRIKLEHPKSMKALSNARKDHEEDIPGKPDWTLDVFEDTVPMTTYSVTMSLLMFTAKKTTEPTSEVEIIVWSYAAVSELIDYVFPVAYRSLTFYFEIFNVPYGFQKLDVVILPDKMIKAKESYGLIILSQEFVTKTRRETKTEYELASIFSRAISQQWIDYRVTMAWWNQSWLHRGLNRFLQIACINKIYPEWKLSYTAWDIVESFIRVQKNEAKKRYNPILLLDDFPTDSLESENADTQEKIHQLIRMTDFMLGSNVFRQRIKTYVNSFEYGHSSLPEIWEAFGSTAIVEKYNILESFSVEEVLKTWLNQRGIPLIDVKQDYVTKQITVTQVPFVSLELDEEKEEDIEIPGWIIPVSCTTENEMNFENIEARGWLTPKEPLVMHVDDLTANQWFILNSKFNVLGHVNYSTENWDAIKRCLLNKRKYLKFDVLTRVRLIHDMMALAEAEKLSYQFVFDTLLYLKYETHYLPLKAAFDEFDIMYERLLGTDRMFSKFREYVGDYIIGHFYKKEFISLDLVHFWESDYVDYRRKIFIVGAACKYGYYRCADQHDALRLKGNWKPEELIKKPRELRKIVLCHSVKHGSVYFSLFKKYLEDENKPIDWAEDILEALCCIQHPYSITRLLDMSLDVKNNMNLRDRFRVFESLSMNDNAYDRMKEFFKKNYEQIRELYSKDSTITPLSFLKILIKMSVATEERTELTNFANSVGLNWVSQEVAEILVNTRRKTKWLSSFQKFTETSNYFQ